MARPDAKTRSLEIGRLPKLRVIDMDSLLFHEEPDPRRLGVLKRRIASDECLKNPPIATRDHRSSSRVLLDGVNRVLALMAIGARRVVVQEVDMDDPRLVLSTWHHAVENLDAGELIRSVSSRRRVLRRKRLPARGRDFYPRLDAHTACLIVTSSGDVNAVRASGGPEDALAAVRDVVGCASTAGKVDRVSYTSLSDLSEHYQSLSALLCYRQFSKREVVALASRGKMFPGGVTRFSVPKRVLSLMVPLSLLDGRGSPKGAQRALDKLVLDKVKEKKIRFYEEPTFYFDD